jgi:hypothetical protein
LHNLRKHQIGISDGKILFEVHSNYRRSARHSYNTLLFRPHSNHFNGSRKSRLLESIIHKLHAISDQKLLNLDDCRAASALLPNDSDISKDVPVGADHLM